MHPLAPLLSLALAAAALAGPLDPPPGPVAPTMKPLSQVEPRIPIDSLPAVLSVSGSYYLTRSLVGVPGEVGILVRARHVTIDLNGFELRGAAGTLDAIRAIPGLTDCTDLVVRNGSIHSWGGSGVNAACVFGSTFEDLRIENNTGAGIIATDFTTVSRAVVRSNGAAGLDLGVNARVSDITSTNNAQDGIGVGEHSIVTRAVIRDSGRIGLRAGERSIVSDITCSGSAAVGVRVETQSSVTRVVAFENGNTGIALNGRAVVTDSIAANNTGSGVLAFAGARIERCVLSNNSLAGITLNGPGTIVGNTLVDNPTGINLLGSRSRVEDNAITGGTTGIKTVAPDNLILRNSVLGATTPFDLAPGTKAGPITSEVIDHPWANFVQN